MPIKTNTGAAGASTNQNAPNTCNRKLNEQRRCVTNAPKIFTHPTNAPKSCNAYKKPTKVTNATNCAPKTNYHTTRTCNQNINAPKTCNVNKNTPKICNKNINAPKTCNGNKFAPKTCNRNINEPNICRNRIDSSNICGAAPKICNRTGYDQTMAESMDYDYAINPEENEKRQFDLGKSKEYILKKEKSDLKNYVGQRHFSASNMTAVPSEKNVKTKYIDHGLRVGDGLGISLDIFQDILDQTFENLGFQPTEKHIAISQHKIGLKDQANRNVAHTDKYKSEAMLDDISLQDMLQNIDLPFVDNIVISPGKQKGKLNKILASKEVSTADQNKDTKSVYFDDKWWYIPIQVEASEDNSNPSSQDKTGLKGQQNKNVGSTTKVASQEEKTKGIASSQNVLSKTSLKDQKMKYIYCDGKCIPMSVENVGEKSKASSQNKIGFGDHENKKVSTASIHRDKLEETASKAVLTANSEGLISSNSQATMNQTDLKDKIGHLDLSFKVVLMKEQKLAGNTEGYCKCISQSILQATLDKVSWKDKKEEDLKKDLAVKDAPTSDRNLSKNTEGQVIRHAIFEGIGSKEKEKKTVDCHGICLPPAAKNLDEHKDGLAISQDILKTLLNKIDFTDKKKEDLKKDRSMAENTEAYCKCIIQALLLAILEKVVLKDKKRENLEKDRSVKDVLAVDRKLEENTHGLAISQAILHGVLKKAGSKNKEKEDLKNDRTNKNVPTPVRNLAENTKGYCKCISQSILNDILDKVDLKNNKKEDLTKDRVVKEALTDQNLRANIEGLDISQATMQAILDRTGLNDKRNGKEVQTADRNLAGNAEEYCKCIVEAVLQALSDIIGSKDKKIEDVQKDRAAKDMLAACTNCSISRAILQDTLEKVLSKVTKENLREDHAVKDIITADRHMAANIEGYCNCEAILKTILGKIDLKDKEKEEEEKRRKKDRVAKEALISDRNVVENTTGHCKCQDMLQVILDKVDLKDEKKEDLKKDRFAKDADRNLKENTESLSIRTDETWLKDKNRGDLKKDHAAKYVPTADSSLAESIESLSVRLDETRMKDKKGGDLKKDHVAKYVPTTDSSLVESIESLSVRLDKTRMKDKKGGDLKKDHVAKDVPIVDDSLAENTDSLSILSDTSPSKVKERGDLKKERAAKDVPTTNRKLPDKTESLSILSDETRPKDTKIGDLKKDRAAKDVPTADKRKKKCCLKKKPTAVKSPNENQKEIFSRGTLKETGSKDKIKEKLKKEPVAKEVPIADGKLPKKTKSLTILSDERLPKDKKIEDLKKDRVVKDVPTANRKLPKKTESLSILSDETRPKDKKIEDLKKDRVAKNVPTADQKLAENTKGLGTGQNILGKTDSKDQTKRPTTDRNFAESTGGRAISPRKSDEIGLKDKKTNYVNCDCKHIPITSNLKDSAEVKAISQAVLQALLEEVRSMDKINKNVVCEGKCVPTAVQNLGDKKTKVPAKVKDILEEPDSKDTRKEKLKKEHVPTVDLNLPKKTESVSIRLDKSGAKDKEKSDLKKDRPATDVLAADRKLSKKTESVSIRTDEARPKDTKIGDLKKDRVVKDVPTTDRKLPKKTESVSIISDKTQPKDKKIGDLKKDRVAKDVPAADRKLPKKTESVSIISDKTQPKDKKIGDLKKDRVAKDVPAADRKLPKKTESVSIRLDETRPKDTKRGDLKKDRVAKDVPTVDRKLPKKTESSDKSHAKDKEKADLKKDRAAKDVPTADRKLPQKKESLTTHSKDKERRDLQKDGAAKDVPTADKPKKKWCQKKEATGSKDNIKEKLKKEHVARGEPTADRKLPEKKESLTTPSKDKEKADLKKDRAAKDVPTADKPKKKWCQKKDPTGSKDNIKEKLKKEHVARGEPTADRKLPQKKESLTTRSKDKERRDLKKDRAAKGVPTVDRNLAKDKQRVPIPQSKLNRTVSKDKETNERKPLLCCGREPIEREKIISAPTNFNPKYPNANLQRTVKRVKPAVSAEAKPESKEWEFLWGNNKYKYDGNYKDAPDKKVQVISTHDDKELDLGWSGQKYKNLGRSNRPREKPTGPNEELSSKAAASTSKDKSKVKQKSGAETAAAKDIAAYKDWEFKWSELKYKRERIKLMDEYDFDDDEPVTSCCRKK